MSGQLNNVQKVMKVFFVFLTFFVSSHLTTIQGNEETLSSEELAFQVGSIVISKYIYEREYDKAFRKENLSINNDEREEWLNRWIERLKIVNVAVEKGYLDKPELHDAVAIMSRYMLIHGRNSPYARIILDPLIESERSHTLDSDSLGIDRLRIRKLAEIKQLIEKQLILQITPVGEEFVLTHLDELLDGKGLLTLENGLDDVLFAYSFGNSNTSHAITIRGFFSEYNNKVMKGLISDDKDLGREIRSFLVDGFLYEQAIKLRLNEDKLFKLEAENYRLNVIYEAYTKRRIEDPTDEDLENYYLSNQERFKQTTAIAFWLAENEDRSLMQLLRRKVLELRALHGDSFEVAFEKEGKQLGFELVFATRTPGADIKGLPPNLFIAPKGWMSRIYNESGLYRLIVKRDDVDRQIPTFQVVKEEVRKDFLANEYRIRKEQELRSVGLQYDVSFGGGFSIEPEPKAFK